ATVQTAGFQQSRRDRTMDHAHGDAQGSCRRAARVKSKRGHVAFRVRAADCRGLFDGPTLTSKRRFLAILIFQMSFEVQPMPLLRRPLPFDDPDWIFELKLDGFRALAFLENGKCQLLSRNGHAFASFSGLGKSIAASLPDSGNTVLDGEIVCID